MLTWRRCFRRFFLQWSAQSLQVQGRRWFLIRPQDVLLLGPRHFYRRHSSTSGNTQVFHHQCGPSRLCLDFRAPSEHYWFSILCWGEISIYFYYYPSFLNFKYCSKNMFIRNINNYEILFDYFTLFTLSDHLNLMYYQY